MIRAIALTAFFGAFFLAGAGACEAVDLVDASPGADSVLVREPAEIALNFRVPVDTVQVRLFKDDRLLSASEATIEDSLAVVAAETDGAGTYLVDWKGTTASYQPLAGAYVFVVDPRGGGSIAVERDVAGASGALGGLRVMAGIAASGGAVALLAGALQWMFKPRSVSARRLVGIGGSLVAIGGVVGAATYGVPSDAAAADVFDLAVFPATLASVPGRAWLAAALTTGCIPFVIVLARSAGDRAPAIMAVVIAVAASLWVSVAMGWLLRMPWPLFVGIVAVGATSWIFIETGRPIGVLVALVAGSLLAVPIVQTVQSSGASAASQSGDLLLELSLDPAERGSNELHLYGFDVSGAGAALGSTTLAAEHEEWDVGPLDLRLVRAGPNHFLSYHADLPISGLWRFRVAAEIEDERSETVDMVLELR
jgi:methionine-rich copper-binding protein CopC